MLRRLLLTLLRARPSAPIHHRRRRPRRRLL
jgi:hypothetical protein